MGTAINPPDSAPAPSPVTRRRGRLQLVLILLLTVGPMVLATGMYKLKFWLPESRSYHGELLGNGQSRAALGVTADEQRWQLLVTAPQACAADCQQLVYLARQLQIGLGRDASRASHALAAAQPVDAAYAATLQLEYPQLQRMIDLRNTLGLRSPIHSLARILNPLSAPRAGALRPGAVVWRRHT